MLTEQISRLAVGILETSGYWGAGGLMALESMIAPVPSEAVMPFVGFLVADGKWDLLPALAITTTGSLVGSLISYAMGYYGGKPFVLNIGKFLLLTRHDLEMTQRFFHRQSSAWAIFLARFIPVIRHFISIPAGTGAMPLWSFAWVTTIGAALWNSFLLMCGMKLRDHWDLVERYAHSVDLIIVAALAAALGVFVFTRSRHPQSS